ncbi:DUF262 domain-containing protein [Rufibacter sp. LB8]|uniref:DUF262 domain-containing protein n=1 Tax=Rufibacter sp. LB8 TaxID=2777781 RepID=UPI00178C6142|nr:DUF262 domain-containing protein [Rufibacter sp. LB8]
MEENSISLKPIGDFLTKNEFNFLVKSYQRGYKWTCKEVKDLLNDIQDFQDNSNSFYCLQPVVVRKSQDIWELIDGQQRFTTIYLILSFLEDTKFNIDYQTRNTSSEFLKNYIGLNKIPDISWESFIKQNNELNNIDNYHFFQGYNAIRQWFGDNSFVDKTEFKLKLKEKVKVIWYELKDTVSKSEDLFSRINSGKIPLTNAELIKALFLVKERESNNNNSAKHSHQMELAQEWDRIEYELQKNDFWYFINKNINEKPTRIEFIFDQIAGRHSDKNAFFSFDYYYKELKSKSVEELWNEVKNYFLTLQEWYEDNELYHYIGFLITAGITNLHELKSEFNQYPKNKFKKAQKDRIGKYLRGFDIDNLKYPNKKIESILLVFNIQTLIKTEISNRFPFDRFKIEKWSLEHIHAQQSKGLNTKEQWHAWLEQYTELLNGTDLGLQTLTAVKDSALTQEQFKELQYKIFVHFNKNESQEDIDNISNLALLDSGTNSSLNNHLFPIKRNLIIDRDKKGKFIPICTKNVFLKYYTKNPSDLYFWGDGDRKSYLKEIKRTLTAFNPINESIKSE